MLERIDHVNLVVDDLSAMTAFYRDVLGLRLGRQISIGGDWIESVTGLENAAADVVYLEADSGPGVELIRYRTPEGTRPARLEQPNTKGIRHVAFRVTDLDGLIASLKAARLTPLSEVQQVPTVQVDFAGAQKRIVYCLDPEGNLLEFCSFSGA